MLIRFDTHFASFYCNKNDKAGYQCNGINSNNFYRGLQDCKIKKSFALHVQAAKPSET